MSEHGHCPNCKVDLDGGDILQTFIDKGETPERAAEIADLYGYGPGHTKWDRAIGQYSIEKDRTTALKCPDCGHEWPIGFQSSAPSILPGRRTRRL